MIELRAPDGTVLQFPEGMTDKQIEAIMRKEYPPQNFASKAADMSPVDLSIARSKNDAFGEYLRKEVLKKRPGEGGEERFRRLYGDVGVGKVGTTEGVGRAYLQGSTFGGGDEAVAAAAAAANLLTGRDPGRSYSELYAAYRGREADKMRRFRRDSPVAAYGAEIAGAIPTAIALPGAKLGGRALSSAITGGYQGLLYGLLGGEPGKRAEGAQIGGLLGGGIGGVAPLLAAGAKGVYSRLVGTRRAASKAGMSPDAYTTLRDVLTADDIATGVQRIRQGGPDAMVADVGSGAQALLDVAMQRTGAGARVARVAVEERAAQAGKRLSGVLDRVLGKPRGPRAQARDVSASTRAVRDNAYKSAYRTRIDYASPAGRAIQDVFDRVPGDIMRRAIKEASDMIKMSPDPAIRKTKQIIAEIAEDGSVKFRELPNVIQLDYIKRALGEIAAESVDQFGRPTGIGGRTGNLAADLRDALKEAVPAYGRALNIASDKIERDQAIRLGQSIFKQSTTREMVAEEVANMTPAARRELLVSMRSFVDDQVANVRAALSDTNMDAREAASIVKSLSSKSNQEKIRMAVGDQRKADILVNQLGKAAQSLQIRASVAQNSKTFARRVLDETVQATQRTSPIGTLLRGKPLESAKEVVSSLTGMTAAEMGRVSQQVYSEIAQALTGPRAADAVRFIQALELAANRMAPKEQTIQRLVQSLFARNAAITQPTIQNLAP